MGKVLGAHPTYISYREAQEAKTGKELEALFLPEVVANVVVRFVAEHLAPRPGQCALRGLCHGAKIGGEVRMLRRGFEAQCRGCNISLLGTDISKEAAGKSNGDVVFHDYQLPREEWLGEFDFIYSNTLDHSLYPLAALTAWRHSLRAHESLMALHHSNLHQSLHIDAVDVYGGSLGDYCHLVHTAGFEVIEVVRLPSAEHGVDDLIFAVRGDL